MNTNYENALASKVEPVNAHIFYAILAVADAIKDLKPSSEDAYLFSNPANAEHQMQARDEVLAGDSEPMPLADLDSLDAPATIWATVTNYSGDHHNQKLIWAKHETCSDLGWVHADYPDCCVDSRHISDVRLTAPEPEIGANDGLSALMEHFGLPGRTVTVGDPEPKSFHCREVAEGKPRCEGTQCLGCGESESRIGPDDGLPGYGVGRACAVHDMSGVAGDSMRYDGEDCTCPEPATKGLRDDLACAWAEYRKDYGPTPATLTAAHKAFKAGWQAREAALRGEVWR